VSLAQYEDSPPFSIDGTTITVRILKNFKQYLEERLAILKAFGRLKLDGGFNNTIWITFSIDKGGDFAKMTAVISNAVDPNSPDNVILIGIYQGPETKKVVRQIFGSVDLDFNEVRVGDETVQVISE